MNSKAWLAIIATLLILVASDFLFAQKTSSPMKEGMLKRVQTFLKDETLGQEIAAADPSLAVIRDMDRDDDLSLRTLGALADILKADEAFKDSLESSDPRRQQKVALQMVTSGRDERNVAHVAATLGEQLTELEGTAGDKNRRKLAERLAPLIKYSSAINNAKLNLVIERARKIASNKELAQEMGFIDEDAEVDRHDESMFKVPILDIGPMGQKGVGTRESAFKAAKFRLMKAKALDEYLYEHPVPVFAGARGRLHVLKHHAEADGSGREPNDHHHELHALHQAGVESVWMKVNPAPPGKSDDDKMRQIFPYDDHFRLVTPDDMPRNVIGLGDFPERGASWGVRILGGWLKDDKTAIPYEEMYFGGFFFANPLRVHPNGNFAESVLKAFDFAQTPLFKDLRGELPKWFGHGWTPAGHEWFTKAMDRIRSGKS